LGCSTLRVVPPRELVKQDQRLGKALGKFEDDDDEYEDETCLNSSNSSILFFLVQDIGRIVMIVGIILAIGGALVWKFPGWFGWIGRLPGDFSVQKGNFSFYFPLVTCILISIVLSLLSWLFRR
jgi:hypothetical protein